MPTLRLKPTYKVIQAYYAELKSLTQGEVSLTFAALLRYCARQFNWTLAQKFTPRIRKMEVYYAAC